MVERQSYTLLVGGSIPSLPTILPLGPLLSGFPFDAGLLQLTLSFFAGESPYEEKVRHHPAEGEVFAARGRVCST